ncbi:MAG: ankyrin repeat domain-containing protein [Alphaproteobacteria bacterium]|nr:ankyrin repeat domain-containing protein [Alphaproteobacteria bacterium]
MIKRAYRMVGGLLLTIVSCSMAFTPSAAQTAPSPSDVESYRGLHRAAHDGDFGAIRELVDQGADLEARDRAGRTPLHVAAFASNDDAVRALVEAGADLNALEHRAYDIVTIAAVANDLEMVDLSLSLGADPGNVTSPYDGTALIAAAHLGHHQVVKRLIEGGAPLDHVNNLNWTALIESVVLGDGGPDHVETARALVEAGADQTITDREGVSPLDHARARGYDEIIEIMEAAR